MVQKQTRDVARSPEDKARKRNHILDAAMKLFVDRGYSKTTMSDVAEAAGVGKGTVYWHFKTKDDLTYSLFEREVEALNQNLLPVLDLKGAAVDKIELLLNSVILAYGEMADMLKAMLSVAMSGGEKLDKRLLGLLREEYAHYNAIFESLLEQGKAQGDVRQDLDCHVVAAGVMVMFDAMYFQIAMGLIEYDPQRLSSSLISFAKRGYLAGGES